MHTCAIGFVENGLREQGIEAQVSWSEDQRPLMIIKVPVPARLQAHQEVFLHGFLAGLKAASHTYELVRT